MIGVLVSLVLRELYKRHLWEQSIIDKENDKKVKETLQDNVVKLYDPSLDETNSETNLNTGTVVEQVQNKESIVIEPAVIESTVTEPTVTEPTVTEPAVTESTVSVPDSELNTGSVPSSVKSESEYQSLPDPSQPETTTKPESSENKLPSVFDDKNRIPDTFKIDEIIDEMVNENPPIIPTDLSLRMEQDNSSEALMNQMENEQEQLEQDENEILTQIMAPTGSNNQPLSLSEISFDNLNEEENVNTVHSEISPMAVELLGEDFNFDSFFEEKLKSKPQNQEPIPVYEIGRGIYQADGGFLANDLMLPNLLPKEQVIISLYPDNLIQNAVVEPDLSETTQNYNFTEELLPMFIRKKKR
ncbi:MAG: hypothetical protein LBE12_10095 [Planctomycetaceae bacterium]|nr:hypothetical protein [Planctomycetaceae bacterium]